MKMKVFTWKEITHKNNEYEDHDNAPNHQLDYPDSVVDVVVKLRVRFVIVDPTFEDLYLILNCKQLYKLVEEVAEQEPKGGVQDQTQKVPNTAIAFLCYELENLS